jgi:hypothetical protein
MITVRRMPRVAWSFGVAGIMGASGATGAAGPELIEPVIVSSLQRDAVQQARCRMLEHAPASSDATAG